MESSVIRIKPYYYVHVLDNNSNVTRTETGPQTFIKQDHEKVLVEPQPMISIPPRHYAVIQNPCVRGEDKIPIKDSHGQIRLSHGDVEIRFEQDPFPLFPGEKLLGSVTPLLVVNPLSALRLRSIRDFKQTVDGKDLLRIAGDEWLFAGPGFYIPHVAVKVVETIEATIVTTNQALRLKARKSCIDSKGVERRAGEEWLVREDGAYLPGVDEEIVGVLEAYILTDKKALHLQAIRTFTDVFGKQRKAGEEWLVTLEDAETHIPDVYEHVVGEVKITTLTGRQYCVILDPCDEQGKPQLGKKELRKGECSFFLRPGERMESGIQDVIVLSEEEALLLRAKEAYGDKDGDGKKVVRRPGDRWMIYGPCDFVPAVEVDIVEKRRTIPLDDNEGIYVRDLKTGRVRSVKGETYMLKPNEELWQKDLPAAVEELLGVERDARTDRWGNEDAKFKSASGKLRVRDKTRVVSFRAPHNASVQVYDFKAKSSRIVFGPELVMLGPDEQFTVLSLSGGKPKQPNQIRTIALLMGPDFMTDIIVVETSDHTRLQLQLSYNWEFRVSHEDKNDVIRLFSIPDFVGDACKAIASRVRGAVAGVSFDNFHKYSAKIIRTAVFGVDDNGKVGKEFIFTANNLVITNIDIQSVEPVDQRTREALQKSVQLAIEITTNAQEAMARHEAQRLEQEARGRLDRQKIADEAEAEKARTALLELRAHSAAVESTGQATAEAKARAEAAAIEGRAAVEQARMKAEAMKIENNAEVENLRNRNELELVQQKQATELEIAKARDLGAIESTKVKELIDSIGSDTIRAIAVAGPEMQVKLLQGLGLTGFLVTDGKNPINLFQTAAGLIGAPSSSS